MWRSYRSDERTAKHDEVAQLRSRVDALTAQVATLTDRLASQTRYIGFLQYLLQKNGVDAPTYEEWRIRVDGEPAPVQSRVEAPPAPAQSTP